MKDKCNHEHFSPVCNSCGVNMIYQTLKDLVHEQTWYRNDDGVKELEDNTHYIKVDDILASLAK